MERRLRSRLKPTTDSLRVDETYIRVKDRCHHFRSFWAAWRKIAGYDAIPMIRTAKRAGEQRGRRSVVFRPLNPKQRF
jgi:hypothetical protein